MMEGLYDKNGKEISIEEWGRLIEDREYRRVAYDTTKKYRISTVWLGLDHNYSPTGSILIFETMVFPNVPDDRDRRAWEDLDCTRYTTLAEARAGHKRILKEWKAKEKGKLQVHSKHKQKG